MDFRFLNYIRRYSNPLRYWHSQYQWAKGLTPFETPFKQHTTNFVSGIVAFLFKSSLNKKKRYAHILSVKIIVSVAYLLYKNNLNAQSYERVKRLFFSFAKAKVLMNKITFPTFIFTCVKTKRVRNFILSYL